MRNHHVFVVDIILNWVDQYEVRSVGWTTDRAAAEAYAARVNAAVAQYRALCDQQPDEAQFAVFTTAYQQFTGDEGPDGFWQCDGAVVRELSPLPTLPTLPTLIEVPRV